MNNPAFYPKAAFKIKLPAEAPPAAARRANKACNAFLRAGSIRSLPRISVAAPIAAPAPREGSQHVMPVMDSHTR